MPTTTADGQVEGVPEPLAGMRSRGGNVYLPIPFAKHLSVSATAGDLYYQVDIAQFALGTNVPDFSPRLLVEQRAAIEQVAARLRVVPPCIVSAQEPPRQSFDVHGTSVLTKLEVAVLAAPAGVDLPGVLANVHLRISESDEGRVTELVNVPLPAFFAAGSSWTSWQGHRLGVRADRSAYCHWPMPLPFGGRIELVGEGDLQGVQLSLDAELQIMDMRMDRDSPRFRASYHLVKGTPTRPFTDHLVLDAAGPGRFVGCSLLVSNESRIWWGEGDEKFWVDGEKFPSWFGTGTEDYFGYAWCDPTPFQAPFHAQVQCDGPMNFGVTQLHRTHALDSVPFQRSFRFELERWHWVEDKKMDYATVAYWYGAPAAGAGLPPLPDVKERQLRQPPLPRTFAAADALEGETLRVITCTGGTHEVQNLSFFESTFSHDAHRWWRDGKPGDALVLAVPIAEAARYRVSAAFVRAFDFGIVQVSLGEQRLGQPFDGFAERLGSSGSVELGIVTLPSGEARLRLELVGKNDKAKDRHMVGLDYLQLEKVQ
ncbi:MAG: glycoside hydrolase family 172 protein [Planctomycetota bacterium]